VSPRPASYVTPSDPQPVVGLDAEGTRDLVTPTGPSQTGLLLPLPASCTSWPAALKKNTSPAFAESAEHYAKLLAQVVLDHGLRARMGRVASTEGIKGFTWWDAMERCVDGYREAMSLSSPPEPAGVVAARPISTVNRVVSRTLAHRDAKRPDPRETIWHLSACPSRRRSPVSGPGMKPTVDARNALQAGSHARPRLHRLQATPSLIGRASRGVALAPLGRDDSQRLADRHLRSDYRPYASCINDE